MGCATRSATPRINDNRVEAQRSTFDHSALDMGDAVTGSNYFSHIKFLGTLRTDQSQHNKLGTDLLGTSGTDLMTFHYPNKAWAVVFYLLLSTVHTSFFGFRKVLVDTQ